MFTENLFERILLEPYRRGANQLKVLTGYASSAVARRHLFEADELISLKGTGNHPELSVEVVYGMAHRDGVSLTQHNEFISMSTGTHRNRFTCHYVVEHPPVHAKVYVWLSDGDPVEGFMGSANYTHQALTSQQVEVMARCDGEQAFALFEEHRARSLECDHDDVENEITLFKPQEQTPQGLENVTLSLLDSRTGLTPNRSGLNWGQRPGRDPNQAYLAVPQSIAQSDFFPPGSVQFTMHTDDKMLSMLCAVAQEGDKAIETIESNAILGKYLRTRLGLYGGEFVELSHLEAYGRTDVTIHKEDDETYHMDFSVAD